MDKIIRTIGAGIMTTIGFGGIRGDLEGWIQFFHLDNLEPYFWWNLIFGIGIVLLIANLVPPSLWRKLFKRLPLLVREKIRILGIV